MVATPKPEAQLSDDELAEYRKDFDDLAQIVASETLSGLEWFNAEDEESRMRWPDAVHPPNCEAIRTAPHDVLFSLVRLARLGLTQILASRTATIIGAEMEARGEEWP